MDNENITYSEIQLKNIVKKIEKFNKDDQSIILNIISRCETNYKSPLITEVKNGTYVNLSKLSSKTITFILHFLTIKEENNQINKLRQENKIENKIEN